MAIYRANPKHGVAWLTGGSSGIGRRLALELAGQGWTVAVSTRPEDSIEQVVEAAASLPGKILAYYCDVADEAGMATTVETIEREAGPIMLAVFNAGVYIPVHGEALDMANMRKTYDVNVFGILNGLVPVVSRMRTRNRGHVVLMGSVTGYFGWPTLAAYGATKAAINNMAEALRYDFEKMNIRIQIVNPGFVDTPLAAKNTHFMPFLMPVDKAGARMMKAIGFGGYETTFPWRLTWLLKFMRMWPNATRFAFMNYASRWRGYPLMPGRTRE
ncbi:SDR family NAD(P)-dependent oxidoreductase [Mesorhizobium sp. ZMM04-5]|uniref:SDR family NAD(P)-dependent oxidoreductase n=1 Tax=Mesorhizobium marinum TaxID=3228790 RepID=A0ABV3R3Z5_9HYPH